MPMFLNLRRARGLAAGIALALALVGCARPAAPDAPAGESEGRETVVLVHGFGRSATAMSALARRLGAAGFAVVAVDYDSIGRTPAQVVESVAAQIDACCAARRGPVHFVGHSLGGLVVRAYLAEHRLPDLGRVVLIGTPNQGTPVVDRFRDQWWMQIAGDTALALGTGPDGFPRRLGPPAYPVGVIAGAANTLENEDVLPGPDDGLVPVESTRLAGMADFIVVPVNHAALRHDEAVAAQTVSFLRTGRFVRWCCAKARPLGCGGGRLRLPPPHLLPPAGAEGPCTPFGSSICAAAEQPRSPRRGARGGLLPRSRCWSQAF